MTPVSEVTRMLEAIDQGDTRAAEDLLPLGYDELRRLAAHQMAAETPGQTLQPTALVHEAWLRLGADAQPAWQNRAHFVAAAAEAMRHILVDRARRRLAVKRGAGVPPLDANEVDIPAPAPDDQLLAVDEGLARFAAVHPRKAELVKLRYFVGLSFEEAAEVLGISVPTAKQWWAYARAGLRVEIGGSTGIPK